jgi:hypothetical protein
MSTRALTTWNIALAIVAALLLPVAFRSERFPPGLCYGVLLLPVQVFAGIIPAVIRVRRDKLEGSTKDMLLGAAIVGPVITAAVIVLSVINNGGC